MSENAHLCVCALPSHNALVPFSDAVMRLGKLQCVVKSSHSLVAEVPPGKAVLNP